MSQEDRLTGLVGYSGMKVPVIAATTAAITLSGEQTIDGIACVTDDRVLVKDQASAVNNGIYVVDTGDWSRAPDADGPFDFVFGTLVPVASGTVNGAAVFRLTTTGEITPGTSSLSFSTMGLLATPVPIASGGTGGATGAAGLSNLGVVQVTAESGTNTITGTVDALVTSLRADQMFIVVPANTNTGATTAEFTPSGGVSLGAKSVFWNGSACVGGELRAGIPSLWQYDGTQYNILNQTRAAIPAGGIFGLTMSNGTDATNDINIAVGRARDSTNSVDLVLATAMGKQLDAAWAAGGTTGSPAGGRMSAAAVTNTTYHVFLIRKDSDGSIDAGFDVSPTAPTMPSGYTYFRRIGSFRRISAANQGFLQYGNYFKLKVPVRDLNSTNPGTSRVAYQVSNVPFGVKMLVDFYVDVVNGTTGGIVGLLTEWDSTDTAPTSALYNFGNPYATSTQAPAAHVPVWTDGGAIAASVALRISASGASDRVQTFITGWMDLRDQVGSL